FHGAHGLHVPSIGQQSEICGLPLDNNLDPARQAFLQGREVRHREAGPRLVQWVVAFRHVDDVTPGQREVCCAVGGVESGRQINCFLLPALKIDAGPADAQAGEVRKVQTSLDVYIDALAALAGGGASEETVMHRDQLEETEL